MKLLNFNSVTASKITTELLLRLCTDERIYTTDTQQDLERETLRRIHCVPITILN